MPALSTRHIEPLLPAGTAGPFVYTETGSATAGANGAGAATSLLNETGVGIAGTAAAGTNALIVTETGSAKAGANGAGADQFFPSETGSATAGGIGAGTRQRVLTRSGNGVAGANGQGVDAMLSVETGSATVGGVGAGASVHISGGGVTYTKAGAAIVGLVGEGVDVDMATETGAAIAGTTAAGSRQRDRIRTGSATVGLVGAGADVDIAAGLLEARVDILRPHFEALRVIGFAAEPGNGDVEGGGVCGARRQENQGNKPNHTTPHLRRSSHSDARIPNASRNTTGISHKSRVSREVMPASEYEISFANLDASSGL